MYYATEKEMERLDELAVRHGLEIRQMMELAGWHMVGVFTALKILKSKKVVIVVGKGNKGGDGLSAARHLINYGWKNVSVILVADKISSDSRHHFQLLKKMKVPTYLYARSKKKAMNIVGSADIIIDSLIGYHLQGTPRGDFKTLIELINAVSAKIISYDLPSGLESTKGILYEPVVRAWATLVLALPKRAFKIKVGKIVSGKIFLGDIGIPDFLYDTIKKGSRPHFEKGKGGLITI